MDIHVQNCINMIWYIESNLTMILKVAGLKWLSKICYLKIERYYCMGLFGNIPNCTVILQYGAGASRWHNCLNTKITSIITPFPANGT